MEPRDGRRAFTTTQKKHILLQQNYKCAMCFKKLDLTIVEFDHSKPWSESGLTIVKNGVALHPDCHRRKTLKENLKKVDKVRKPAKPKIESKVLTKQELNRFTVTQLKDLAKKHNIRLSSNVYTSFLWGTKYTPPTKQQYVNKLFGKVFNTELK